MYKVWAEPAPKKTVHWNACVPACWFCCSEFNSGSPPGPRGWSLCAVEWQSCVLRVEVHQAGGRDHLAAAGCALLCSSQYLFIGHNLISSLGAEDDRIIELSRLENPSQTKQCPIPTLSPFQSTECHIQEILEHHQGWGLQHFLGSPFHCLKTQSGKKFLIKTQLVPVCNKENKNQVKSSSLQVTQKI